MAAETADLRTKTRRSFDLLLNNETDCELGAADARQSPAHSGCLCVIVMAFVVSAIALASSAS